MSLLSFFGLQEVGWFFVLLIIAFVFILTFAILDWKYEIRRKIRQSGLSWIAFIPLIGRRFRKNAVYDEFDAAKKGTQYSPESLPIEERRKRFMEFIQDLPIYQIDDDIFSSIIRSTLGKGGANYQQVVLHDSSSVDDVMIWVRKEGNSFIHNKGVYLFPWEFQKTVLHWDIQDCRPMEDKSPQAQWESPKMNARYFWGMLNSVAMNKEQPKDYDTKMMIVIALSGLAVLISVYIAYNFDKANDQQLALLRTIAENTKRQ